MAKWRDYSGGEMTNMGAHGLDQIQSALGMDDTGPVEFWPVTPDQDNGKVSYRYANGIQVDLELAEKHGPECGAIFTGDKGKIEINRNKFTTNPKDLVQQRAVGSGGRQVARQGRRSTWPSIILRTGWTASRPARSRSPTWRSATARSPSAICATSPARWAARSSGTREKEQIVGDEEANRLLSRPRRKGYELPDPVAERCLTDYNSQR